MIRRGLRRGVRTVGCVGARLRERGSARLERAVDLVGRDMHEAKLRALISCQRRPVSAHRVVQSKRANDIGGDEISGPVNRAIDMALRYEVDDGARPVCAEQMQDQITVTDVAAHEYMARISFKRREIAEIAGVSQLVKIDDRLVDAVEPVENEIGPYEPGASGHHNQCDLHVARTFARIFLKRGILSRVVMPICLRSSTRDTTARNWRARHSTASPARNRRRPRVSRSPRTSRARLPAAAARIP